MGCYCSTEIGKDPQRISNLRKFENNHDWSGLEFPVAINKIKVFEKKNGVSVTILALKGSEIYIARRSECKSLTLYGMGGGWNPPPLEVFLHCAKTFGTRELKLFDF